MRISREAQLSAGPDPVWRALTDWERQPEWMVDAAWVRVLGPSREGTGVHLRARTKILGISLLTETLTVTVWEPPQRLVVTRPGFIKGRGEWTLEPSGQGTRFVWTEDLVIPVPLLGELALWCYRPVLRLLMGRSISNLAATLR
jgi:carbon monoxide dehydrogenase subunit G